MKGIEKMALTREQGNKIKIDGDVMVGFSGSGGDICAEQLAKWAYRRLELWPDLLKVCEELISFCESKERLIADDACPTKAYKLAKAAIAKVS